MRAHRRVRIRTAMRGLGLTVLLWAALIALAEWRGATWPTMSDARQGLILLAVITEFLWLKSWMMGAMTRRWDRLGTSLIAANIAFSLVYVYAMAVTLFPHWALTGAKDFRYPIRYGLVAVLAWGIVQLMMVPDPEEDDLLPSAGPERRGPTSWERSAAAHERVATATEEIASQGVKVQVYQERTG